MFLGGARKQAIFRSLFRSLLFQSGKRADRWPGSGMILQAIEIKVVALIFLIPFVPFWDFLCKQDPMRLSGNWTLTPSLIRNLARLFWFGTQRVLEEDN
jgi:hypothetical protein